MALFGAHVSSAGSILRTFERAEDLGAEMFQFFLGSPRSWERGRVSKKLVRKFEEGISRFGGPVVLHASYLINLASEREDLRRRSLERVVEDLIFCEEAGVHYYNLHPGRSPDPERGIRNLIASLEEVFSKVSLTRTTLILENTAGAKGDIGANIEELGKVVSWFGDQRIGVCIDTCHAFAYGYRINTPSGFKDFKRELEEFVGLDRVKLIHANDSKAPLGSRKDRHYHIGKGHIGEEGFRNFLKDPVLSRVPYCIETPMEGSMDRENLNTLRRIYLS